MNPVVISESLGSQGDAIGKELAGELGYEFADREIITRAAQRYHQGLTDLHHVTDERPTLWERFTDSRRHYLAYVEATILELAEGGRTVLVGHGAAIVLKPIPHVLRVRVTAPEKLRAERVRQQRGLAEEAALELVRESDHERNSRIRYLYHVNLDDPLQYDLVLNTERSSVAEGVRLIREALDGARRRSSAAGLEQLRDLSLAAQGRAQLMMRPLTRSLHLSVTAADGRLTVRGVVDSEELRAGVIEILRSVAGAEGVNDELTVRSSIPSFARV